MNCSPSESVEVKVNSVVVSGWVLSEVAKVDSSVGVTMCVPVHVLQVSFGDILFSPSF